MCGFLIGLLGAYALFRITSGGCGGRFQRRHHHRGRRRERRMLDWLFAKLDTSHGQEKVVEEAAREFHDAVRSAKGLGKKHKRDLADIIRGDAFDHEAVGEAWTEQDEALEKLRMAFLTSLQKVHEVLDRRQRDRLADMLDGSW